MNRSFVFVKIHGKWMTHEEAEEAYGLERLPYLVEDIVRVDITLETTSRGRVVHEEL